MTPETRDDSEASTIACKLHRETGLSLHLYVVTERLAVLLSLWLAQARNTFRVGGAYIITRRVPDISSARAGHWTLVFAILNCCNSLSVKQQHVS